MAKKASHNVASVEWLNACINKKGPHVGKIGKKPVILKWLSEHESFSGTRDDQAKAINEYVGGQVEFTVSAADISAALQSEKSQSTAAPKTVKNGQLHELIKITRDKLGFDSKEDLLKAIEDVEFCWVSFLITKLGNKTNAIEAVKGWHEASPTTFVDPLA